MSTSGNLVPGPELPPYHPDFWEGYDITDQENMSSDTVEMPGLLSRRQFHRSFRAAINGLTKVLMSKDLEVARYGLDSHFDPHPLHVCNESLIVVEEEGLFSFPTIANLDDNDSVPIIRPNPPISRPFVQYWQDFYQTDPTQRNGLIGEEAQLYPDPGVVHVRHVYWGVVMEHPRGGRAIQPFPLGAFKLRTVLGANTAAPNDTREVIRNPSLPRAMPVELGKVEVHHNSTAEEVCQPFSLCRVLSIDVIRVVEPRMRGNAKKPRRRLAPKLGFGIL